MNSEPSLQTTSKGSPGQEDWRANPNESLASGRVEFISFSIGNEQYGVDIMAVVEVGPRTRICLQTRPGRAHEARSVNGLNIKGVRVREQNARPGRRDPGPGPDEEPGTDHTADRDHGEMTILQPSLQMSALTAATPAVPLRPLTPRRAAILVRAFAR